MIKVLKELGIKGTFLNILPIANIILNGGKNESISFKIRKDVNVPTFPTLIQYSTIPSQNNERKKRDSNKEEEVKLSLFSDDIILYLKDPKKSTKKLLDLINTFSKVAGYKTQYRKITSISMYKELSEKEARKIIPFTIASRNYNT
jgi:hypothetical protein